MSLKRKATSGFIWTFAQQFSVQVINFLVQIILARVLLPSDFGLIAMLSIFMSIGLTLMDGGFGSSLIRTPNADHRDYSTVFFINLTSSLIIYIVLYLASPYIAGFYNQPLLSSIIKIYSLSFIIRAFVVVQTTKLTKEMKFKVQMTMQIPSVIIGATIGIIMAYSGYGVWSIVWMNLIQSFLYSAQHWIRSGWYPSFIIDREKIKYHFGFGYKMTLSSLLNTTFNNIYNLIIGKFFSASQLGFYNRADTIQKFPTLLVFNALNRVTYPMFAAIQDDNVKLKNAYKKLMQQVIFWIAPLMIFLGIVAAPLFSFVLTDKWLPAVPFFQILCVTGILFPLGNCNLQILKVKGRSDLYLRIEVIKKIITSVVIVCALPFGIYGLLYCQVILSLITFYINAYYSGPMINYPPLEQTKDSIPIVIAALITGSIVWALDKISIHLNLTSLSRIVLSGIQYLLIYLSIAYFAKLDALNESRSIISKIKMKKKSLKDAAQQ